MATYDDKQINDFCELAQEVGITRAMRELNYPNSWSTGQRWAKLRGIEVALDELQAKAAATREWYKEEEVKALAELGMDRVTEDLMHNRELTADDKKKLSEAATKFYNIWANIQGKATNINETRTPDAMDTHLMELLNAELSRNDGSTKEDVEREVG